nr:prolyl oligopeptidase family serine peptidase [uncultured Albidiferax sp.]
MNKASWRTHGRKLVGGMLLASSCSEANEVVPASADKTAVQASHGVQLQPQYPHLRPGARLGELLNHPAFQGFSHQMLPWDGRTYDDSMPLGEIGQLLPYHSHVDPAAVAASLNRLVDEVNAGRTVFYDFHTEDEKRVTPTLKYTGLFFFRGRPGAPFAVVAPGGGFSYVGSVHEGFPYAEEIIRGGLNAFVLKYRAGLGGEVATEDLAAAVSYIFKNAGTLQVGTDAYSLWGSSAGARMAAAIGSHGTAYFGGAPLPKPSVVVMAYTRHSEVTASEPSTFVVVGDRDGIAPPAAMQARVAALRRIGTRVEYRQYPNLGHGFGTGQGTPAQGWIGDAVQFWLDEIKKQR